MEGIVLKASAGTGKTYRLSLEYLATLLKGESYKDILVMTFTKKATSEIQERVIIFLEEIYKNPNSDLYENLLKLYPDLDLSRENIKNVYYEVLDNKDRLKIYTIDGFINNIFKSVIAPYLNIYSYDIIDDKDNIEILLKCFEKIVQDKKEFNKFKLFLQNRTERNVENYLEILKKLIENRWKITLVSQSSNIKRKIPYDSEINIEKLIGHIFLSFEKIKEKKKEEKELSDYMSKPLKWITITDKNNYIKYIEENWNEILKGEKCYDGRRVKTTKKVDLDIEIEVLNEGFSQLKKEISKIIFNRDILSLEDEVLDFIENLYDIYDKIKFSEKRFTHLDVSSYLFKYIESEDVNLIRDNEITEYFKEIFDSEFKIIFIDEFQDTSILQWKILKGLINKCEKLICVGDEKQSIYGWRGGEKSLFENLSKIINIDEETMNISYRSYKNIIQFTNEIFQNISESYGEDDENKELGYTWNFDKIVSKSDNCGFVEVIEKIEIEDEEISEIQEENMVSTLVDSIENRFQGSYKGIGVIARSNAQLNEIALELGERKIPYVVESNASIVFHRAINPIFKCIKYIVNLDTLSLIEFLRCDVIKINNSQMKKILENIEEVEDFIFKDIDFKDLKFKDLILVLEKIKRLLKIRDSNTVLNIVEIFNITKYYSSKSDLKNIFYFIELSKDYNNIVDFYKNLMNEKDENRYKQISLEESNAITLLSIHKSKGLEFETVYYYHNVPRKGIASGIQFYIDFKEPFNEINNFIFVEKKYEKVLLELDNDFLFLKELQLKDEQEEINNLYVALTRAKKNMFLVLGKSINKYLKEAVENLNSLTFGKFSKDIVEDKKEKELIKSDILKDISLKEEEIEECEQPVRSILIDILTEEKRIIGNAVHNYLEYIIKNKDSEHKEAKIRTFSKYASIIGEKRLEDILSSGEFKRFFIENPIIFSEEWDYIYPEYEIYDEGKLKRIDRIMIKKATKDKKGEILVVDYKTGGINQLQLDEYIQIIENHLKEFGNLSEYNIKGEFLEIKL